MFHPLAFTKSFAMVGVAILAITFVPAIIPIFIKGRLRSEEDNWIVRSFINIYKPVLTWLMNVPAAGLWFMGFLFIIGAGLIGSRGLFLGSPGRRAVLRQRLLPPILEPGPRLRAAAGDGAVGLAPPQARPRVSPGIHGQSNHLLDTPWPKVLRGKESLERIVSKQANPSAEDLFAVLADHTVPDDMLLPDTGIGLEKERLLSSLFVSSPAYGTRSSTVILVNQDGEVTFCERTYNGNQKHKTTVEYKFNCSN